MGNTIREDTLFLIQQSPRASSAVLGHQTVQDMSTPAPCQTSRGAFPETMQHGFSSATAAHWTPGIQFFVNPRTPFIYGWGSVPNQLQQTGLLINSRLAPHSIPPELVSVH
jgi:hypothetical protein